MPDTKLRPTSAMKSKNKSSEQRLGHENAINRNHFYYSNYIINEKKLLKTKIRTFGVFGGI